MDRRIILLVMGLILFGIVVLVFVLRPFIKPERDSSLTVRDQLAEPAEKPVAKEKYQAPTTQPSTPSAAVPLTEPGQRPRIVIIRNLSLRDPSGNIDDLQMKRTLNEALRLLFQADSGKAALKMILQPRDKIGLKVNTYLGHKNNVTHPELVDALAFFIKGIGIPENNIIVWDRSVSELEKAGYKFNRSARGMRCLATLDKARKIRGVEPKPVMDFDKTEITVGQVRTRLSNILTKFTTVTINMPVLKTHKFKKNTGVNIALQNMYQAVELNDKNIKELYANECDPGAAEIYSIPQVKDKTRLIICDALNPLYNGGPMDDPRYHTEYNGLIVGTDPVALDIVGQSVLQKIRQEQGDPKWPSLISNYLMTAGSPKYRLGESNLDRIEIIEKTLR